MGTVTVTFIDGYSEGYGYRFNYSCDYGCGYGYSFVAVYSYGFVSTLHGPLMVSCSSPQACNCARAWLLS